MASLKYQIRPFRYGSNDMSDMSDINALGCEQDELTKYMTRNVRQNWTSYRAGFCRSLKLLLLTPGAVCYVAEDEASKELIGWAIWSRHGNSPKAKEWQRPNSGLLKAAERMLLEAEKTYYKYVPNADPTRVQKHMKHLMPILGEEWAADIFFEYWELDGLYVHPQHYRKGIGKRLAKWGIERGREEKVPVVVYASSLGRILYESVGFEIVKRMNGLDVWIPEYREALEVSSEHEARGAWAMCSQPEGTDFLERARRKLAGVTNHSANP